MPSPWKEKFKEGWTKLEPQKKKKVVQVGLILAVLLFALFAYKTRRSGVTTSKKTTHEQETQRISLGGNIIEKSLYRQAEEKIERQNKVIRALKEEVERIKEQQQKKSETQKAPSPKPKKAKETQKREKTEKISPPPPPLPPSLTEEKSNKPLYVPIKEKQAETVPRLIGGISMVSTPPEAQKTEEQQSKKKQAWIYLPPSFMEATLLSGVNAPIVSGGSYNPIPVLLRIKDLAILPNRVKANLKGCFVIGEARGNLATERVEIRLTTLSCVAKDGSAVIDQRVKGFVVDEDGKVGLKGLVVAKMGALLARSALAGLLGGIGGAMQSSVMNTQLTAVGTQQQLWSSTDTSNLVRGAVGGGISGAAGSLQKFYLQLAKQALPVIEVGATKTVTVVISEGVKLEVKNAKLLE